MTSFFERVYRYRFVIISGKCVVALLYEGH